MTSSPKVTDFTPRDFEITVDKFSSEDEQIDSSSRDTDAITSDICDSLALMLVSISAWSNHLQTIDSECIPIPNG